MVQYQCERFKVLCVLPQTHCLAGEARRGEGGVEGEGRSVGGREGGVAYQPARLAER